MHWCYLCGEGKWPRSGRGLWVSRLSGQCAVSSAEKNWGTLTTDEWVLEFIN